MCNASYVLTVGKAWEHSKQNSHNASTKSCIFIKIYTQFGATISTPT